MALTAAGALAGVFVSFAVLRGQAAAAIELEAKKSEIVNTLEDKKADIVARVEELKGVIGRQNAFISSALSSKANAYEQIALAANVLYRELEHLSSGEFDTERARTAEAAFFAVEGLRTHLKPADQTILQGVVQSALNIRDAARTAAASLKEAELDAKYAEVWISEAGEFGKHVQAPLQQSSMFRDVDVIPPPNVAKT